MTAEQKAPEKQLTLESALPERDDRPVIYRRKQKVSWFGLLLRIVIVIAALFTSISNAVTVAVQLIRIRYCRTVIRSAEV